MQSFLLDEIMAFMLGCSKRIDGATPLALNTVTGELKVRYLRAMRTPGVLLVESRLVKKEGRKLWTEAEVKDENGVVLASAEALFISVKPGTGPKM
jgi:acyl-coenzyme A thioesterase PaaI-like protein